MFLSPLSWNRLSFSHSWFPSPRYLSLWISQPTTMFSFAGLWAILLPTVSTLKIWVLGMKDSMIIEVKSPSTYSLTELWYSCLHGVNSSLPQNICFLLSFSFWDSLKMNLLFLDCPEMFLKHLFGEFIYFCSLERNTWLLIIGTTLMNIKAEASFSLKMEQRLRLTWVECILFMKKKYF